jgi:hypothetical protein
MPYSTPQLVLFVVILIAVPVFVYREIILIKTWRNIGPTGNERVFSTSFWVHFALTFGSFFFLGFVVYTYSPEIWNTSWFGFLLGFALTWNLFRLYMSSVVKEHGKNGAE